MKIKVDVPKLVVKMMERLVATGLYGRTLEECAFRLMGNAMQEHLAKGGLLHDEFRRPEERVR